MAKSNLTEREQWLQEQRRLQQKAQKDAGDESMVEEGQASAERKGYFGMLRPELVFDKYPGETMDYEEFVLGSGCNEVPDNL